MSKTTSTLAKIKNASKQYSLLVADNGPEVRVEQKDCIQFLKDLKDSSVDLIVTDPAYSGMNEKLKLGHGRIVGNYGKKGNKKWFEEFRDDPENFRIFLRECKRSMKDGGHIFIMFDNYSLLTLGHLMREFFEVKNIIVWDKVNLGMGHYFRRRHEMIVFATKGFRKLNNRRTPDVWRFKRIHRAGYPTQKPVELFEAMINGSASKDYLVVDPFLGSGSSAIAAIRKGCKFIGNDISDESVELSCSRIKHFKETGIDPLQPDSTASPADIENKFW